jgi:hypothetical protein
MSAVRPWFDSLSVLCLLAGSVLSLPGCSGDKSEDTVEAPAPSPDDGLPRTLDVFVQTGANTWTNIRVLTHAGQSSLAGCLSPEAMVCNRPGNLTLSEEQRASFREQVTAVESMPSCPLTVQAEGDKPARLEWENAKRETWLPAPWFHADATPEADTDPCGAAQRLAFWVLSAYRGALGARQPEPDPAAEGAAGGEPAPAATPPNAPTAPAPAAPAPTAPATNP